ncbi:hypothetical protein [Mycoplasma capricolum]|uniref:hypothetical protein n=1 Tax=Mycoplasma capricolum TaxID=2095 RepID=UPI0022F3C640|nr:hypothetical protein [Mycoplasma capricolum]WBX36674.1 hypothetical protein NO343_02380 [Mycoplasma capricolum subsp. capricolum]
MIIFSQQTTSHIPTWAVYLILVLGLIGLIVSSYGATCALRYHSKLKNKNNSKKVQNILSTRQSYDWDQINTLDQKGFFLIGVTFKNFDFNKNKTPITILKSTDLITDINKFKSNLNDYKNLTDYMNNQQLLANDLIFFILEKAENLDELNQLYLDWLSLISS